MNKKLDEIKSESYTASLGPIQYPNQTLIVIGFIGPLGSGCTFISRALADKLGYAYFKPSDIIREYVDPADRNNVQVLQNKGNELREERGPSFLIEEIWRKFQESYERDTRKYDGLVIDGIKNEEEVRALRLAPNFFLFSIQADKEIRSKRLTINGRFKNEREFEQADNRDQFEENKYGQQVKKCDYLSDVIILNNENIPKENDKRKVEFIDQIYWRYLKPIQNYAIERKTVSTSPTIDEFCMTMAYSASKMSSCLKRQVGAVVAQVTKAHYENNKHIDEKHSFMPFIISSGYNDVPLGSPKCLFHEDFQMCYRDYLQQNFSQGIKYCPTCGKKIELKISCYKCGKQFHEYRKYCDCKNELNIHYKCQCSKEIFKEFIPGASLAPGKMLDMCRALHAEEVALLNLAKYNAASADLVLYTTTQPCNLCANKIVNSGIKTVVYSEPYTLKESEIIFNKGGVKTRRFEGIKSSAFFKLY